MLLSGSACKYMLITEIHSACCEAWHGNPSIPKGWGEKNLTGTLSECQTVSIRSGLKFCQSRSASKLFAKVISRLHSLLLVRAKEFYRLNKIPWWGTSHSYTTNNNIKHEHILMEARGYWYFFYFFEQKTLPRETIVNSFICEYVISHVLAFQKSWRSLSPIIVCILAHCMLPFWTSRACPCRFILSPGY